MSSDSERNEMIEEFIRQFDAEEIEIRPDPASELQTKLADDLAQLMTLYKRGMTSSALARALEMTICQVRTQGMVQDGTRVIERLKECQQKLLECQQDSRKLSQQMLEYKNKLGLKK